jgi:hypothetical protein
MSDPVTHPAHYCLDSGSELIEFLENLPYCRGAAIKYIFRAGRKDPSREIEDLRKAEWMIRREISRLRPDGATYEEFQFIEEDMP